MTKIRLVFRVASGETAGIVFFWRTFESLTKTKSERGAACDCRWTGASSSIKSWTLGWWIGLMESGQELAFIERLAQKPIDMSRKNCRKCLAGRKANLKGLKRILPRNRKNCGRIRPRRWNAVLQEALKCDVETCGNQHIEVKTTQYLFEVVHDVEGGRTRAVCWRKTVRVMIRTADKEGSPGDDKIRLVFRVASGETAGIAGKKRAFESPTKTNPSERGCWWLPLDWSQQQH